MSPAVEVRILNHWTTREVPTPNLLASKLRHGLLTELTLAPGHTSKWHPDSRLTLANPSLANSCSSLTSPAGLTSPSAGGWAGLAASAGPAHSITVKETKTD